MNYIARINVESRDRARRLGAIGNVPWPSPVPAPGTESRDVAAGKTGKPEICITHYAGD